VVDAENDTVTASVTHFTTFAVVGTAASLPLPRRETPASLSLSDLTIQPQGVEPGEPVTVTVSVANTGDARGTLALQIDGVIEATMTVAGNTSETVSFTVTREEPGEYTVAVGSLTGSFTVATPEVAPPPEKEEPTPEPAVDVASPPEVDEKELPVGKEPIEPAGSKWPLVGGIIAGVVVVGVFFFFFWRDSEGWNIPKQ
ncbi:hypothetical protein LCGC14_2470270, partial [marine sediment metagenome]